MNFETGITRDTPSEVAWQDVQIWNGSDEHCWRYRADTILSTDGQTDRRTRWYQYTPLSTSLKRGYNKVNSLWPSDPLCHHRSGSTLVQVMAYRLFNAKPFTLTRVEFLSIGSIRPKLLWNFNQFTVLFCQLSLKKKKMHFYSSIPPYIRAAFLEKQAVVAWGQSKTGNLSKGQEIFLEICCISSQWNLHKWPTQVDNRIHWIFMKQNILFRFKFHLCNLDALKSLRAVTWPHSNFFDSPHLE